MTISRSCLKIEPKVMSNENDPVAIQFMPDSGLADDTPFSTVVAECHVQAIEGLRALSVPRGQPIIVEWLLDSGSKAYQYAPHLAFVLGWRVGIYFSDSPVLLKGGDSVVAVADPARLSFGSRSTARIAERYDREGNILAAWNVVTRSSAGAAARAVQALDQATVPYAMALGHCYGMVRPRNEVKVISGGRTVYLADPLHHSAHQSQSAS